MNLESEFQQAQRYEQQGNLALAKTTYEAILRDHPDHELSLYGLALIYAVNGDIKSAKDNFEKVIEINPANSGAFSNLGNCYTELADLKRALACFEKAIEINPQLVDAHYNLGNTLCRMNRQVEAISSYLKAQILSPDSPHINFNLANSYGLEGQYVEALEIYKRIEPVYADNPNYCLYIGCTYFSLRNFQKASEWFLRALSLKEIFPEAYNELARLYTFIGKHTEAMDNYLKAAQQAPDSQIYLENIVKGYMRMGRLFDAYQYAQRLISPSVKNVLLQYLSAALCEWGDYSDLNKYLLQGDSNEITGWDLLRITDSAETQYTFMKSYMRKNFPANSSLGNPTNKAPFKKIKIAYYSPDFRNHAVMHLAADIFRMHNREAFEVYAFSMSPELKAVERDNVTRLFDHYFEINELSDLEVAKKTRELGIDIAVDLTGNTRDLRTGIFALRVAPIQINYLGYTGTLAAEYYDYIIADRVVIPPEHQQFYSEKLVYLKSFMPRQINLLPSSKLVTRAQVNLPPEGFIFCCFNKGFKFNPPVFASWMRILKAVPLSYLWFNNLQPEAIINLKKEAQKQGIDPNRLILADYSESMEAHLARHRLAGLFLDTFPYNAHTTASDALWSGLPVVTRVGNSFASRVAASLLTAIGLPELITTSIEDYESLAIGLANDPQRLNILRRKLKDNIKTHRLFDMKKFMVEYEGALTKMSVRALENESPEFIDVENLLS
jgi:predicted O-linked N-acetylglucosamine transferase (SPINDLY family)